MFLRGPCRLPSFEKECRIHSVCVRVCSFLCGAMSTLKPTDWFSWNLAWTLCYLKPIRHSILGAIAKLRKATMGFVMSLNPSIRLSVRTVKLGSHWTDLHEIWYLGIFRKSVEKIQVSLKSDNNNGYFTWRPRYTYNILLNSSENEKFFTKKLCRKSRHTLYVQ
jgi:hypothetical protein